MFSKHNQVHEDFIDYTTPKDRLSRQGLGKFFDNTETILGIIIIATITAFIIINGIRIF